MNALGPTLLRLDVAGFLTQWFRVSVPQGHTLEDIKNPPYWQHHWEKMNIGDFVRCLAEDGSFDVTGTVIDKVRGAVRLRIVNKYENPEVAAHAKRVQEELAQHAKEPHTGKNDLPAVRYTNSRGWHVLGYDSKEVVGGLKTKVEADKALAAYLERTKAA